MFMTLWPLLIAFGLMLLYLSGKKRRAAVGPEQSEMFKVPESLEAKFTANEFEHFRLAFSYYDRNNNGYIEMKELGSVIREVGGTITDDKLKMIFAESDTSGDGLIDFSEFLIQVPFQILHILFLELSLLLWLLVSYF